jgi:predicted RecA/RadA family phage recombinase
MACARLAVAVLAAFAVAAPSGSALAAAAPKNVHAFTLRVDEPVVHTFSRTPSFAWNPVRGAKAYQFELSTSRTFSDSGRVWSAKGLRSPAVSVPVSLPWMTGNPYSLYAHARAITSKGATAWSKPFGFNMRWADVPQPVTPAYPGMLRWTAVSGANAYMVWLIDTGKTFTTRTTMADEREYFTFHQAAAYSGVVHWRVRPVRWLYGETENGVPPSSFGPWSPIYTSYNPPFVTGPLTALATVSNVVSDAAHTSPHEVMPGFAYQGNTSLWNTASELYRVVVFTDEDCLNPVFRGAITGAPAYVPRSVGPLAMPTDVTSLASARNVYLTNGAEPNSFTFEHIEVKTNESDVSSGPANSGAIGLLPSQVVKAAKVDLWDNSWAGGRYYWTVVPVNVFAQGDLATSLTAPALAGDTTITVANPTGILGGDSIRVGTPGEVAIVQSVSGNVVTLAAGLTAPHSAGEAVVRDGGGIFYKDGELTQDACASGRRLSFAKASQPAVTGRSAPYASGLSPNGKLVAASSSKPRFYGEPLVAWQPVPGADQYEVQWSRRLYPWRTRGSKLSFGTSLTLPLTPGTWYYRVRGLDFLMTGSKPQMSWSSAARVVVTKPRFRVVR